MRGMITPFNPLVNKQFLPELSKLFRELYLDCLEELSNGVTFSDHHLASVACPIPVAVGDRQRLILHYLSASEHKPISA